MGLHAAAERKVLTLFSKAGSNVVESAAMKRARATDAVRPEAAISHLLKLVSAISLAHTALHPLRFGLHRWTAPVRRLQSGHVGDYVAWLVAGMALLTMLTAATRT